MANAAVLCRWCSGYPYNRSKYRNYFNKRTYNLEMIFPTVLSNGCFLFSRYVQVQLSCNMSLEKTGKLFRNQLVAAC